MLKDNLITERYNRIQRAVNLERQDRTPVVLEYSGCDIPTNAKLENVQAMVEIALEV